ncbi:DUF421 domain-containing protein [Ammoniphilus sp. CFH 90114]|uniref:DUF421 domain-containing protein n=1 Tax=Ammoniphilus sp. CFH 90114 TaxID=2493665 RepID=UPI00100E9E63|nr:YetF domain-containing protein [Ammoniphilus sp. CFH 90114]RXT14910.1 DUF421 domain-containing protein [Ammoniphilus sp. CFH 90114]
MDYLTVVFKTFVVFVAVIIGFRIMGNQAVGRLTAFDLVVVIALGALMGAPLADDSLNIYMAVTAVASLVFLQRFTAFLTVKSKWFAKVAIGEPIKLIEQGKIYEKGLYHSRLTYDNLMEELRLKGVTKLADVELAYLEPEGQVSVIPIKEKQPLTRSDLDEIRKGEK